MNNDQRYGLLVSLLVVIAGMILWGFIDMNKQEPPTLTGMYIIQTYEIADIENRLFDIERRLSEVEQ